jgi:hypothetical protein
VACPSKKLTSIISVDELNGKALKEAGRLSTVANRVSDGYTVHGTGASMMEITKAIEQIFR